MWMIFMGNAEMVQTTGAKLVIHEEDAKYLTRTQSDLLGRCMAKPSPPADIEVKDGDMIRLGKIAGCQGAPYAGPFARRNVPLHGRNGFYRRFPFRRLRGKDGFSRKLMGRVGSIDSDEAFHITGRYGRLSGR